MRNYPMWLCSYLVEPTYPVSGVSAYWTASPDTLNSGYAWSILYIGALSSVKVDRNHDMGLRPVITIPKSYIQ